jgi:hypothetical protein
VNYGQSGDARRASRRRLAKPKRVSQNLAKSSGLTMARVLLVGYDPETVDYSNPALPPGMSAEKIRAGLTLGLKQMTDRGWEADLCLVNPDETAGKTVERHLTAAHYACVLIGAGIRLPPQGLALFELVVNAVHRAAPDATIAFNTVPEDSGRRPLVAARMSAWTMAGIGVDVA